MLFYIIMSVHSETGYTFVFGSLVNRSHLKVWKLENISKVPPRNYDFWSMRLTEGQSRRKTFFIGYPFHNVWIFKNICVIIL